MLRKKKKNEILSSYFCSFWKPSMRWSIQITASHPLCTSLISVWYMVAAPPSSGGQFCGSTPCCRDKAVPFQLFQTWGLFMPLCVPYILWGIMNIHYLKFKRALPCLLSVTSFHSKRVIIYLFLFCSTDCWPFHGTDCCPQASHPLCWETIHHKEELDSNCFHLAVGTRAGRKAHHCISPYISWGHAAHFRLCGSCLLIKECLYKLASVYHALGTLCCSVFSACFFIASPSLQKFSNHFHFIRSHTSPQKMN